MAGHAQAIQLNRVEMQRPLLHLSSRIYSSKATCANRTGNTVHNWEAALGASHIITSVSHSTLSLMPRASNLLSFFSDTIGARALPHNAVDLHPGLPRGNLTVAACVNACEASGK